MYGDSREWRMFDFSRYELSKSLPTIIDELPHRKCFHTERGNFFTVDMVGNGGARSEYNIFFAVSRSSRKGVLNLFVQSAHIRDNPIRKYKKSIGFWVILHNVLNLRPIRVGR